MKISATGRQREAQILSNYSHSAILILLSGPALVASEKVSPQFTTSISLFKILIKLKSTVPGRIRTGGYKGAGISGSTTAFLDAP